MKDKNYLFTYLKPGLKKQKNADFLNCNLANIFLLRCTQVIVS